MTSTRQRAAVGAIGTAVLLFAAAACSSESSDSADSPPATAGAQTTVASTQQPNTVDPGDTTSPADVSTTEPGTDGDDPAPTAPPVVVPESLQFTAPLVGGGTFDGAAVAGKPTVLWFWGPT